MLYPIGLMHYVILATCLFGIGLFGVMTSRNVIRVLMALELMFNAVNINFVAFNNFVHPDGIAGQIFAIFILTVAAAEASVGLAIVIALYRGRATVDMDAFTMLKG
jgi:NAD(P)H-quinone oxidoreductase subunit 4L